MNSRSCDSCQATTDGEDQFDFCHHCGADLCPACFAKGCCGRVPATSGTDTANVMYQTFGNHPPSWAMNLELRPKASPGGRPMLRIDTPHA